MKKKLKELTIDEYCKLQDMGFLYEFYPEATGNYFEDTKSVTCKEPDVNE